MSLPVIFSLVFFLAFSVYFILMMYILQISRKSTIHWVFVLCCIALCIWAFAFSIANSAPDIETSVFWRRVATFGWGTFFSFLLHFILLLTGHRTLMGKKWIYLVLYLPAVLNISVFFIFKDLTQYHMIKTYAGWINNTRQSLWDWLYDLYYSSFSLTIAVLLGRWGITSKEKSERKQGKILFISFLVAIIVGTLTEFVINYIGSVKVPQIAPVLAMLPISCMCYCIRHYGLIRTDQCPAKEGQILNDATRNQIFGYLAQLYVLGAFISFLALYFFMEKPMREVILFSGTVLCGGILLQQTQNLKTGFKLKNVLSYSILILSVPYILLRYIDQSPFYAWVIPVILIIFSIAFNHKQLLSMIGLSALVTYVLIMVMRPAVIVSFQTSDHIIRIFFMVAIVGIAHYINRIYLARLAENEEQMKLQKLLSDISALLITVNDSNIYVKSTRVLQMCGEHFDVDRTYLYLVAKEDRTTPACCEWVNSDIDTSGASTNGSDYNGLPNFLNPEELLLNGSLWIQEVTELPEHCMERKWMEDRQVKSLLILPLRNKESLWGIWSFERVKTVQGFSGEQLEALKIIANLLSDIYYKIEVEKEISYRAYYDSLTGLPNRELFKNRLSKSLLEAGKAGRRLGVVFIDIDSFKLINDTIGHEGGDSLLIQLGRRISRVIKPEDTISRYGGDEFLLLISQAQQVEEIISEANRIIETIKQPIMIKNQEFFVTVSAGIAIYPYDGDNVTDLIKHSDLAMYVSKQKGKNNYTLCSEEMKNQVDTSLEMTSSLHRALERNEILVYYQPQIRIDTGEITGFEVMVRWQHPEKGLLHPKEFYKIAEKSGLIHPIGQLVLETACRQNMLWQEQGMKPLKIAVNLSAVQFRNPNLVDIIHRILKETKLPSSCLEFEVSEGIAVNEAEATITTLQRVRELGIGICVDAFGTEYSSLNKIMKLPVDRIKLEEQFLRGIGHSDKEEGVIKVIIQLGRTLGMDIIAEGVETEEQLVFLKTNQCELAQGNYYYDPMLSHELEELLRKLHCFE